MSADLAVAILLVVGVWLGCGVTAYVQIKARWVRQEATRLEDIKRGVFR